MPYIGNQPGTGVRSRFIYTATASQTTFTGADDNSKTLKYADSAYVDVFLNGVCLVPGTDYTASTKTSVVLTQAASVSDTLEVVAYDIATIADTVSKADGGQFDGAVTVEADFTVDSNTLHVDSANNKVGILDNAPDAALHVYNGMLQVGSKDGDTSVQQNANAIRIAAVPNSSTEWGGLQWYREFSNYIGAEIIAARASATEANTDLIFKTSSTNANATERMRITHDGVVVAAKGIQYSDYAENAAVGDGLNITEKFSYDDNNANSIGSGYNNHHNVLYIQGGGGMTTIPMYANGGSGVAWQVKMFDPDDLVWRNNQIDFVSGGSAGNTFQILISSGGGSATIQRTSGSAAYLVYRSTVSGGTN